MKKKKKKKKKTNITPLAKMRKLGKKWKETWMIKSKLMKVMVKREARKPLQGDVSVDDAYLGGERTGGGPGRGSTNKIAFAAAVKCGIDDRYACESTR